MMNRSSPPARLHTVLVLAVMSWPIVASAQSPLDSTFTYQGRLKQNGGLVVGATDLKFSLYDAATGGNLKGGPLTFDGVGGNPAPVDVVSGLFTAALDFGSSAFNGENRWLEISVRHPAGSGSYATLSVRQQVTAAPYALQTRGLFVDQNMNVGVGQSSPHGRLDIKAPAAQQGSGHLALSSGTVVTGDVDTVFTEEIAKGDIIFVHPGSGNEQHRVVADVTDDDTLITEVPFNPITITNSQYSIRRPALRVASPNNTTLLAVTEYGATGAGLAPLGSIVAWHKNLGATPLPIPDGWQECDGTELPVNSPLRETPGITNTPDLNSNKDCLGNPVYGGGKFLRGGSQSSDCQEATALPATAGHHTGVSSPAVMNQDSLIATIIDYVFIGLSAPNVPATGNFGFVTVRPLNMSVVWIMRVK